MKLEKTAFTEKELALIKAIAEQRGITEEEAATALFSEGLEKRVRRRTGKGPAKNVRTLRGR